jgi:hypothetical protein
MKLSWIATALVAVGSQALDNRAMAEDEPRHMSMP